MRSLGKAIVWILALNFLAVVGAAGWLMSSGRLDRGKIGQIRQIVFAPLLATTQPATQPAVATTRPALNLDELLARHAGLPVTDQVAFIRGVFDTQMAQLDRRNRELNDLQAQVLAEKRQLASDRVALDEQRKKQENTANEATRLASDKGFQETLELMTSLPSKQAKSIFMGLADDVVVRYLAAMDVRMAAKILKEFKSPEEVDRAKRLLELMRQPQAAADKE